MNLKESKYNIRVDLSHGKSIFYNSLSRSMCLLESDENQQLSNFLVAGIPIEDEQLINQLMQQGVLVPEEVDELKVVKEHYQKQRFENTSAILTICPTLACNFGCDYCFQGADKSSELMSEEVKDGIITLFRRMIKEHPNLEQAQLSWYGGEPLVKKNVIYELSDRLIRVCEEENVKYVGTMVSNGHALNKEVAQKLYDRALRHVQITLDGSQEYHDARRHLLSGKGTYDKILSNLKEWIDEIPIQVNIRVNIDERNKDNIRTLIDDLHEKGFAGRPNFKIYFAPVESMTKGCHAVSEQMIKKMDYGRLESELYLYAYNRGLTDIPYPPQFIGICSAIRPFDFIVVPCGSVHKCWDTVSFANKKVGSVFEQDALFAAANPRHQTWNSFDPFSHPTCKNCKILPNCAGFCAHKFVHASEAIGEASLPCPSLKYSIKEKLVLKAESMGYITSDDYDPKLIRTDPKELCSEKFEVTDYHYEAQLID